MDMAVGRTAGARAFERKAWRRVFEDGLSDLFLAVAFLNAAVWMVCAELDLAYGDNGAFPGGVLLVAFLLFRFLKQRVTVPRLGHFRIRRERTSKLRLAGMLSLSLTVLLVGVTFLVGSGAFEAGIPLPVFLFGMLALMVVALFCVGGYLTGVARFYVYGALAAAGMVAAQVAAAGLGLAQGFSVVGIFGLPALLMTPTGVVLLARFVRAYRPAEGTGDGR